jgi:integrase
VLPGKSSPLRSRYSIFGHNFGHELCADARPRGNIEARGNSLRIRVYAGPDPVPGKPVYLRETVRGTDDAAHRTAKRALNRRVAEAEKERRPSSVISLSHAIDEWLRVAEHEESTRRPT